QEPFEAHTYMSSDVASHGWTTLHDPNTTTGATTSPHYYMHDTINNNKFHQIERTFGIELTKGVNGFGFTLVEADLGLLIVKNIIPGGPAFDSGAIEPGDVLVSVDGKSVAGFLHIDIAQLFSTFVVGQRVRLAFSRGLRPLQDQDIYKNGNSLMYANMSQYAMSGPPIGIPPNMNSIANQQYVKNNPPANVIQDSIYGTRMMMNQCSPRSGIHSEAGFSQPPPPPTVQRSLVEPVDNHYVTNVSSYETEYDNYHYVTVTVRRGDQGFGFTISDDPVGQKVNKILDGIRCVELCQGDVLVTLNAEDISNLSHNELVATLKRCPIDQDATFVVKRKVQATVQPLPPPNMATTEAYVTQNVIPPHDSAQPHSQQGNDIEIRNLLPPIQNLSITDQVSVCTPATSSLYTTTGPIESNSSIITTNMPITVTSANNNTVPSNATTTAAIDTSNSSTLINCGATNIYGTLSPSHNQHQLLPRSIHTSDYGASLWGSLILDGSRSYEDGKSGIIDSFTFPNIESDIHNNLSDDDFEYYFVDLERGENGFGFRIMGGAETDKEISVGSIVIGGNAHKTGILKAGDEIISINDQNVMGATHQHVVELMSACTTNVRLMVRRHKYSDAYDVILNRNLDEGFGFVIISCANYALIGRIIEGSPAHRCQRLQIRDRIIAVNGRDITSSMTHPEIVNMIKESGHTLKLRIIPADCYAVELIRSPRGFGFSIRGGADSNGMPLFILRVAPNGPAHSLLNVGDQIIEINGISTVGMTHRQAATIISNSEGLVRLKLRRNYITTHAMVNSNSVESIDPGSGVVTNEAGQQFIMPRAFEETTVVNDWS
ncbi:Membrane-associated guanylate kinase, WW and PDZ domain-containing protein 3, partial [Fragariocoptes setiger]